MEKTCLIVEGGGFKTGFTTGVLDAFQISNYRPFDLYLGNSGGSIAASYFLSHQYRQCIAAMKLLAKDKEFTKFTRSFGDQGYMDIDYLKQVADENVPLDLERGMATVRESEVYFVATHRETGLAHYLTPTKQNWLDILVASSTLPFVTKGTHRLNNTAYFDGGWSDPLPAKWAYNQGARKILVIRTTHQKFKSSQNLPNYLASIYYKNNADLCEAFANSHQRYNEGVEFIANPPKDLIIEQIAPIKLLKSTTYTYTNKTIMSDYRYGLDKGLYYVAGIRNML